MKLNCVKTGAKSWMLLASCRPVFVTPGPEGAPPSRVEAAPVSPVEVAKDGVKTEITAPLRAQADVKMDALAEKKAREDKLLKAVSDSEGKAKTEGPKDFTNRQRFGSVRFANEHQEAFMSFLQLSDASKARDVVGVDGNIDYSDFEGEDSAGSKDYGFYWDTAGSKWKIDTPGYRLDKKDISLSYKFEEAILQIIDIYEKNPGWTALKKDKIPAVVATLKAAYTKYQMLNAKKGDFGLKYSIIKDEKGGNVDLAQAVYDGLQGKSAKVLKYFKENYAPGWHRIADPDVIQAAFQCGVANIGNPASLENADTYMYMVIGNQLYRKPIDGGQVQMMEMSDQPKTPFKGGFLEEKHFAGMFHNINFANVQQEDVDKALRDDLAKNPASYVAILGETPKPGPDGKPLAPGETPTLTPDKEKFKQGLFINDIIINPSVDVTGAILADSFKTNIQTAYDRKYDLKVKNTGENPVSTTKTPESEAALQVRNEVIAVIVADLVKKFDAWKTANPKPEKPEKAGRLQVTITPTYEVKGLWKNSRGGDLIKAVTGAGEAVADKLKDAKDKVAKLLGSKVGKLLAFLGILDEQKLIDHFSGKKKIEGMGLFTFLAGVGDNKQMDKLAEKQPWMARLKSGFDKMVDKVAGMVGIETKDEVGKKYVSGLRELANSGPIKESFTLETQMGDSFDGLVITSQNTDFPINRYAKYRKIGETDWKEGQLADAKGYEVMVNQALSGIQIPKGVVIGIDQKPVYVTAPASPEAAKAPETAAARPPVAPPPVLPTPAPTEHAAADTTPPVDSPEAPIETKET